MPWATGTRVTPKAEVWNRWCCERSMLEGCTMATITELRATERSSGSEARTPAALVGALLIALAVVLGAPIVGVAIAGVFCVGMMLAELEHRTLRPGEFAAIAELHALAVVLLSF